ncbi:MAG: MFS transporter [Chloroflexota bacterium]|nr:MFS transporter [Chloroflexota bacterium]MDQ5865100.1 MFS transporter [Chloroflexota bacterium]
MSATDEMKANEAARNVPAPDVPLTLDEADVVAAAEAPTPPSSPWRNRDYMLLLAGHSVSSLGSRISGAAFPLLVLALTNNDFAAAGIVGALYSLPYLLFSLPAGALIDRWDRKLVMILCDVGRAAAMGSIPLSLLFGGPWLWQLYLVAFVEGTLFVFFNIAEVAALPRVVAKAQLPAATGFNHAAEASTGLIGPPIGTVLFVNVGRIFPFLLDAVSYTASVVSLLFVRTNFKREPAVKERHLGREIKEGVAWLWSQPLVRFMSLLTGGNNFAFSGLFLVIIARVKELGIPEDQLGIILSIGAVGGIVGSVVGGKVGKQLKFGPAIITIMWLQTLLFPFYAIAPNLLVLGIISALIYLLSPIYNVVQFSYRLALIPDALQGRVNSSFRMIAFGFMPLGQTLVGFLLVWFNTTISVLVLTAWLVVFSLLATINSHVRNAKPIEEVA